MGSKHSSNLLAAVWLSSISSDMKVLPEGVTRGDLSSTSHPNAILLHNHSTAAECSRLLSAFASAQGPSQRPIQPKSQCSEYCVQTLAESR